MRIGLVIYGSLGTVSGGYLYDRRLVAYLKSQGDQVDIISRPWRGYALHLADNLSPDFKQRLEGDYDIVLQDELNHPSLVWINRRLRQTALLVAIVHHLRYQEARPLWQNRLFGAVERRYLRTVDAFIYNSQTTRRAVEVLAEREQPCVVAYPGGDRFEQTVSTGSSPHRPAARPLKVLFVGNLIPRKGLHTLLAALAQLPANAWRLTIVGNIRVDPDYARQIRRLLDRFGMDQQVKWRGSLNDAELAQEMASSHVLAVPSSFEGFGIVYLEGMGFGLPAIATTGGAAGEIITDGENGFLVPPEDPKVLAACLSSLVTDRSRLTRMSRSATERFASHPTWQQSMASIRDFLITLIT
jgi:glycosyltransferase involved in cell wall biosynthesis